MQNDVSELVCRHWNRRAATFDDEAHHGIHTVDQRDRWLDVLRAWTGTESCRALDVGCGTGVISRLLSALGHEVVGVDFAPAMLERAREKAAHTSDSVDVLRGDAQRLPVATDAVDLLAARHLVWTLPDPHAAIREWRRVVEAGGEILLIEGHWEHEEPWAEYEPIHADLPMFDGRPPARLREVLLEEGLRNVEFEPLTDPTLWGREPSHDYYVLRATVPK